MKITLKNAIPTYTEKFKNWVFDADKSYCSGVCDQIHGFDFSHACFIHDGYYGREIRLPENVKEKLKKKNPHFIQDGKPTRLLADRRFYKQMRKAVKKQSTSCLHRIIGESIAFRRYMGVRSFGWRFYDSNYST